MPLGEILARTLGAAISYYLIYLAARWFLNKMSPGWWIRYPSWRSALKTAYTVMAVMSILFTIGGR
jgi:hypothetical protein